MERKQELQLFVVLLAAMKKMDVENAEMKAVSDGMVGLYRFAIIA